MNPVHTSVKRHTVGILISEVQLFADVFPFCSQLCFVYYLQPWAHYSVRVIVRMVSLNCQQMAWQASLHLQWYMSKIHRNGGLVSLLLAQRVVTFTVLYDSLMVCSVNGPSGVQYVIFQLLKCLLGRKGYGRDWLQNIRRNVGLLVSLILQLNDSNKGCIDWCCHSDRKRKLNTEKRVTAWRQEMAHLSERTNNT